MPPDASDEASPASLSAAVRVLPGLLFVSVLTAAAFALVRLTGATRIDVAAVGVLLGVLAGNLVRTPDALVPGLRLAAKRVLALAVALLGLLVTVDDLVSIGREGAVVVAVAVLGATLLAALLARPLGVRRPMALLLGGATGVCGVATIAALRNVVEAEHREVTYAIGAITLLASVGLVAFPVVQLVWHPLPDADFGVLAGATLHSVPQAVGAGFAGGGLDAGAAATFVKLARVALLGPLVVLVALVLRGRAAGTRDALRLPLEVWGFLALFALGSTLALPGALLHVASVVDKVLLVAALTALGVETRFEHLRHTGVRPLLLAAVVWLALVAAVLGVLWIL